jgi:hypothetical protein
MRPKVLTLKAFAELRPTANPTLTASNSGEWTGRTTTTAVKTTTKAEVLATSTALVFFCEMDLWRAVDAEGNNNDRPIEI